MANGVERVINSQGLGNGDEGQVGGEQITVNSQLEKEKGTVDEGQVDGEQITDNTQPITHNS